MKYKPFRMVTDKFAFMVGGLLTKADEFLLVHLKANVIQDSAYGRRISLRKRKDKTVTMKHHHIQFDARRLSIGPRFILR